MYRDNTTKKNQLPKWATVYRENADYSDRRHRYYLKQTPSRDNKNIHNNNTCAMRMSHNCDTFVTHYPMAGCLGGCFFFFIFTR